MTETILTISLAGLLAGFVFSMPVAGPVSILITTRALGGRRRYCNGVSIGASVITFAYVFLSLFGLARLYRFYEPAIPWLLLTGALFLLLIGYRVSLTRIDMDQIGDREGASSKVISSGRGGFYTGLLVNLFNPTLFIGWLTSTFLVISFVTSLGFNMGGLDSFVDTGVREIENMEIKMPGNYRFAPAENQLAGSWGSNTGNGGTPLGYPAGFHLLMGLFYALFVAAGSITWFWLLAFTLDRFRNHINTGILSAAIKGMGVVLVLFGVYFGYLAITIFMHQK